MEYAHAHKENHFEINVKSFGGDSMMITLIIARSAILGLNFNYGLYIRRALSRQSPLRRFYFRTRFPCISRCESRTRLLCRHGHVIRTRSRITPAPMWDAVYITQNCISKHNGRFIANVNKKKSSSFQ